MVTYFFNFRHIYLNASLIQGEEKYVVFVISFIVSLDSQSFCLKILRTFSNVSTAQSNILLISVFTVSFLLMGIVSWQMIGPLSIFSSSKWYVTPPCFSPFSSCQKGANRPLYFGNNAPCRFIVPNRGIWITSFLTICWDWLKTKSKSNFLKTDIQSCEFIDFTVW